MMLLCSSSSSSSVLVLLLFAGTSTWAFTNTFQAQRQFPKHRSSSVRLEAKGFGNTNMSPVPNTKGFNPAQPTFEKIEPVFEDMEVLAMLLANITEVLDVAPEKAMTLVSKDMGWLFARDVPKYVSFTFMMFLFLSLPLSLPMSLPLSLPMSISHLNVLTAVYTNIYIFKLFKLYYQRITMKTRPDASQRAALSATRQPDDEGLYVPHGLPGGSRQRNRGYVSVSVSLLVYLPL